MNSLLPSNRGIDVVILVNGKAIAGQVDKIPLIINNKVIDEHGLSGCRRCHGEPLTACKHVDQTAFSDIRTTDKRILRLTVHIGTLVSTA